eukprot:401301-Pelagomonas_calceolata.AAC.1
MLLGSTVITGQRQYNQGAPLPTGIETHPCAFPFGSDHLPILLFIYSSYARRSTSARNYKLCRTL